MDNNVILNIFTQINYKNSLWEFSGGSEVRTLHSIAKGPGSISGQGTKNLQVTQPKKKKTDIQIINKHIKKYSPLLHIR